MWHMNLLGTHDACAELRGFAELFFSALGISNGEERESGNYVDGYYFKGSFGDLLFIIAQTDEVANDDLPYWIHVSSEAAGSDRSDESLLRLVREKALPSGFRLAKILNFGKQGEERIDY